MRKYTIIEHQEGKPDIEHTDTFKNLLAFFKPVLEKGASYNHEKDSYKINTEPKSMGGLINNLYHSKNNASESGVSGYRFTYRDLRKERHAKVKAARDARKQEK